MRRADVRGEPIVTVIDGQPLGSASVPFIGLAEGLVLSRFRKLGVPLQRIRPAIERLKDDLGLEHVLASRALYSDGAELLYDYAKRSGDTSEAKGARELVVVRNGQRVFNEVVEQYLRRVEFAGDGYALVVPLPGYVSAQVVADPRRGFGHPRFKRGGAKVEDVLGMFMAGESLLDVAAEYRVPLSELEDALRVASRHAA